MDMLIHAPLVDSNRAQNRVPLQTELETLRNIRSEKQQLADITKRQLEQAKAAHERIQTRHYNLLRELEAAHELPAWLTAAGGAVPSRKRDNLLRELEAAKSELDASHDYLLGLQQQVTLFQAEDDRFAGLLHPIRRCPEDILRLVFESAVDPLDPFPRATTLSHVCQSWRSIALNTVSLWNIVVVFMDMEIDVLKSFIQCTKTRVKSAPLKGLKIQVMQEYSPEFMEAVIKLLGLEDFTKIAQLTIFLKKSAYVTLLPHLISHFPQSSSLDSIRIKATTESFPLPSWDFSGSCLDTAIIPQLQSLKLVDVSTPSIPMQFNRLVALKRLKVTGKAFRFVSLEQGVTLAMLEELDISSPGFPWDRITAPKLWKVGTNKVDTAVAFFGRHPTIRYLRYQSWIDDNEFDVIAKALVKLEYLDIGVPLTRLCRPLNSNSPGLPFQKLRHLVIEDAKDARISLEDFEELVRSRCQIQRSHGRGDLVPLGALFIVVDVEELDSLCWRKSSLLTDVCQTVSIWQSDNSVCTVELRWLK